MENGETALEFTNMPHPYAITTNFPFYLVNKRKMKKITKH